MTINAMLLQRQQRLQTWASGQFPLLGLGPLEGSIEAVSGDASFRRYFRGRSPQGSFILVDAPPDKENSRPFLQVAAVMAGAGVRVPAVLASDLAEGFMCLEDFGGTLLWPALEAARVAGDLAEAERLYQRCFEELLLVQQARDVVALPPYDDALLLREMRLFTEWCCGGLLGLALNDAEQRLIEHTFAQLSERALRQPRVLVHRDYHSRNLMLLNEPGRALGVIDFQDAVRGPATYDLVSLLKDCYIEWPADAVQRWALRYAAQARAAGVAIAADDAVFLDDFAAMGAQRHIKVLGIFSRLWLRDGKPGYLKDMPLTFRYTVNALAAQPAYAAFSEFLQTRIAPVLPAALANAQQAASRGAST